MRRLVIAVAATAALVAANPSSSVTTATGAPDAGGAAARCVDTAASARLAKGSTTTDPNTVTPGQARAMERALQARVAQLPQRREAAATARIDVQVVWHVITRADGSRGVTNSRIDRQLRVMNRGFAGLTAGGAAQTPFRFATQKILRTANTDWNNWTIEDDDRDAKTALHRGTAATLNMYVVDQIAQGGESGILGYATFPGGPLTRDGVVVIRGSLPGGNAAPYDNGDTTTHEVGHWIHLFHTFQSGCRRPGDRVSDTPFQFDGPNVYKCNRALDTCPRAGSDPVHNFMSYGTDACLERFTPGQSTRMENAWYAFRAR